LAENSEIHYLKKDGANPSKGKVPKFLKKKYSKTDWLIRIPLRSPELNSCDFFLWGGYIQNRDSCYIEAYITREIHISNKHWYITDSYWKS